MTTYKGHELNAYNYNAVLQDFSTDIREEVFLALNQGIDISDYIDTATDIGLDGEWWLHQVRHMLQEGISPSFSKIHSGRVLRRLRGVNERGFDYKVLEEYLSRGMSEEKWITILGWYYEGIGITNNDFESSDLHKVIEIIHMIPDARLGMISGAFKEGLPVWELVDEFDYNDGLVPVGIMLMRSNRWDIGYAKYHWDVRVLDLIAGLSTEVYNRIYSLDITKFNTFNMISRVISLAMVGADSQTLTTLLKVDSTSNQEVYDSDVADIVLTALREGLDTKEILECTKADAANRVLGELRFNKLRSGDNSRLLLKTFTRS